MPVNWYRSAAAAGAGEEHRARPAERAGSARRDLRLNPAHYSPHSARAASAALPLGPHCSGSFKAQHGCEGGEGEGQRQRQGCVRDRASPGRSAVRTGAAGTTRQGFGPELPAPSLGCFLCLQVFPKPLSWRGAQPDELLEAILIFFFFFNALNTPKGMCYLLGVAYLRGSVSLPVTSRGKIIGFTR